MKRLTEQELPKEALDLMSETQRSYIDEFEFIETESGKIHAWYAGELLAVWTGKSWALP
jgi:hypothetical protein